MVRFWLKQYGNQDSGLSSRIAHSNLYFADMSNFIIKIQNLTQKTRYLMLKVYICPHYLKACWLGRSGYELKVKVPHVYKC